VYSDGVHELAGLASEPTDEEPIQQLENEDQDQAEDVALIDYDTTRKAMVRSDTLYERVLAASDALGLPGNQRCAARGRAAARRPGPSAPAAIARPVDTSAQTVKIGKRNFGCRSTTRTCCMPVFPVKGKGDSPG
jgi:hypothetical protein